MKTKQFLCLLAIVPFIFFSCEKKFNDHDYRDKLEGVYITSIRGSVILVDAGISFPTDITDSIVVRKSGSKQLELMFSDKSKLVTVNRGEGGDLIVPTESYSQTQTDLVTGALVIMNLTTSSDSARILKKALYIEETFSGNAIVTRNGEVSHSNVSGKIIYRGIKKED